MMCCCCCASSSELWSSSDDSSISQEALVVVAAASITLDIPPVENIVRVEDDKCYSRKGVWRDRSELFCTSINKRSPFSLEGRA